MKEIVIKELVHRVIGMQKSDAIRLVEKNGFMCRVTSEDGIQFEGTASFIPYRINIDVIDRIVRESRIG